MFNRLVDAMNRLNDRVGSRPPPPGEHCRCPDQQNVEVDDFCPLYDDDGIANGFPHCRTCHLSFAAEEIMGRHLEANPTHRIGYTCGLHDRFEILARPRPWRTWADTPDPPRRRRPK